MTLQFLCEMVSCLFLWYILSFFLFLNWNCLYIAADAFSVDISYLNILPQYMYAYIYYITELEHTLTSYYVNINI